ncbi:hypothetical protein TeGR_g400, partial [Tetraparma gracilis]
MSDAAAVCLICAESFSSVVGSGGSLGATARCVQPCGHDEFCGICLLTMRVQRGDDSCPVCKAANERLIVPLPAGAGEPEPAFSSFTIWGDELGPDYLFHEQSRMFLPKAYHARHVRPLFEIKCGMRHQGRPCNFAPDQE